MNSKNTLRLLFIFILATIVATTQSSSAIVPDKGPSASGEGQFTFNSDRIDFSFQAKLNKNGKGHGRAEFDNLSDQTHVVVKINCVIIFTTVAELTGIVQQSDDPALPEGTKVIFAATDRDPGFGDSITPLVLTPNEEDCGITPLGLTPLNFGDILIEP